MPFTDIENQPGGPEKVGTGSWRQVHEFAESEILVGHPSGDVLGATV